MEKVVSMLACKALMTVVHTGIWFRIFKVEKLQGRPNKAILAKDPYYQMAAAKSELRIRQLTGRRLHDA